jgi:hypothetical protein
MIYQQTFKENKFILFADDINVLEMAEEDKTVQNIK